MGVLAFFGGCLGFYLMGVLAFSWLLLVWVSSLFFAFLVKKDRLRADSYSIMEGYMVNNCV
jgi:hypothetical protein